MNPSYCWVQCFGVNCLFKKHESRESTLKFLKASWRFKPINMIQNINHLLSVHFTWNPCNVSPPPFRSRMAPWKIHYTIYIYMLYISTSIYIYIYTYINNYVCVYYTIINLIYLLQSNGIPFLRYVSHSKLGVVPEGQQEYMFPL